MKTPPLGSIDHAGRLQNQLWTQRDRDPAMEPVRIEPECGARFQLKGERLLQQFAAEAATARLVDLGAVLLCPIEHKIRRRAAPVDFPADRDLSFGRGKRAIFD